MPSFGQWCQLLIIFSKRFSHSCYGREYFRTKFKRIIAFLYASLPINLVFFHCRSIWRIFIPTTFRWGMEIILTFKPKVRSVHWNKWSSFCIVISDLWIIWQNSFVVRTPSSAGLLWCSTFCWGPVVVALWGVLKWLGCLASAEALWLLGWDDAFCCWLSEGLIGWCWGFVCESCVFFRS